MKKGYKVERTVEPFWAVCYCTEHTSTFRPGTVCAEWLKGGTDDRCARCGHWVACHLDPERSAEPPPAVPFSANIPCPECDHPAWVHYGGNCHWEHCGCRLGQWTVLDRAINEIRRTK